MVPAINLEHFERHDLGGPHGFYTGRLPDVLSVDTARFDELWAMHPEEYDIIRIHGRPVRTPRWVQAYGRDYYFSGKVNAAQPVPRLLEPFLAWGRDVVDVRLSGLLVNWYDGSLGHYIGPHHDKTRGLVVGSQIVTISLGEERIFRLTRTKSRECRDFSAGDGAVFVTPWETNNAWKHQIVKSARRRGRRISVTLRAFAD
ncbi:MAG: alpha-ketoglutarate-dependent dioxygenase AlkB [Isosphaeraceae bacterium]